MTKSFIARFLNKIGCFAAVTATAACFIIAYDEPEMPRHMID